MARKQKPLLQSIVIESIAAEGKALAHIDGKVLFVPQAIPGDVVDVQVTRSRRGYMEGYITRQVTLSPHRIEPFCCHFGRCGGCKWQALPYPMQLKYKQQQVEDQLVRIGRLDLPGILPILGSDKTVEYRNKLEYTFSNRRWILKEEESESLSNKERYGVGFHISGMFDKVLDITKCHLQREPTNALRLFVRDYALYHNLSFFDLREQHGFMRTLIVRTSSTGELMVIVVLGKDAGDSAGPEARDKRNALLDALSAAFPEINSLYYVINPKGNDTINDLECVLYKGEDAIYEQMESLRFKIGPKSFYQTNSEQAYRLYSVVREYADEAISRMSDGKKPVIYDLYTGTGTIALFLSSLASKVVGIDYVPEAIDDARLNAGINSIDNAAFFAGDMKDILNADFILNNGAPDIVVLDPPRAGIHPDVAQVLLEASPEEIIYVSCNPATQARDLAILSKSYRIVAVQPVDMFPHTHHVENVVNLTKIKDE